MSAACSVAGPTSSATATPGYLGTTAGVTDDNRFILFTRWQSEEAGNELLMRTEMQTWWEEFQQHFDGPVDFAETDDVTQHLAGGSDAAGFVQAIKVSNVDRARVEASDRQFEAVAPEFRPDLIGGIRVWTSPDGFVEANYFTSEDSGAYWRTAGTAAGARRGLPGLHRDDEERGVLRLSLAVPPLGSLTPTEALACARLAAFH